MRYCTYNLQEIRESGLLSAERMAEIDAGLASAIVPARLADGAELTSHRAVRINGSAELFHIKYPSSEDYMIRHVLSRLLTEKEIDALNRHCFDEQHKHRNAERFSKAVKIPAADYHGYVNYGDQYYATVEELLEAHPLETIDGPVFACTPLQVIPDRHVADLLEDDIANNGYEDMGLDDLEGLDALNVAYAAFVKANEGVVSQRPDYTRAIILSPHHEGR